MPKYLVHRQLRGGGVGRVLFWGGSLRTVDAPDNTAVAALCARVSATGLAATRTIVLLTPEEMDAAAKLGVNYRPPGS